MPVITVVAAATGVTAAVGSAVASAIVGATVSSTVATAVGSAVISGLVTAAQGGDAGDILESAVKGGVTAGITSVVAPPIADAVAEATGSSVAGSFAAGAVGTAVGGGSAAEIVTGGALAAGSSALQGAISTSEPDFSVDYSLPTSSTPNIPEMGGGQGLTATAPQTSVIAGQDVNYSLAGAAGASVDVTQTPNLQPSTTPNIPSMGGGQGLVVDTGTSVVSGQPSTAGPTQDQIAREQAAQEAAAQQQAANEQAAAEQRALDEFKSQQLSELSAWEAEQARLDAELEASTQLGDEEFARTQAEIDKLFQEEMEVMRQEAASYAQTQAQLEARAAEEQALLAKQAEELAAQQAEFEKAAAEQAEIAKRELQVPQRELAEKEAARKKAARSAKARPLLAGAYDPSAPQGLGYAGSFSPAGTLGGGSTLGVG